MGNAKDFFAKDAQGRRSEYESVSIQKIVNGVTGRIIKKKGDSETHTNLPYYSNTSDVYFRKNVDGVCQARVYVGNKKYIDFDWSHTHENKSTDKRKFEKGTIHVQVWVENDDGSFTRQSDMARNMNNLEMKKYGPILREFCPLVKLK